MQEGGKPENRSSNQRSPGERGPDNRDSVGGRPQDGAGVDAHSPGERSNTNPNYPTPPATPPVVNAFRPPSPVVKSPIQNSNNKRPDAQKTSDDLPNF
jgi:hypothetical protein